MKFEIKHRFSGSILFSLECESFRLCVEAAVKARADLAGADLAGANLAGADLARADLAGAYLARAYHVIAAGTPNGWTAFGWLRDGYLSVRVGCHDKRLDEARVYWTGKDARREVMAALVYIEAVACIRGWKVSAE